jgi:hypothetical protein
MFARIEREGRLKIRTCLGKLATAHFHQAKSAVRHGQRLVFGCSEDLIGHTLRFA